MIQPHRHSANEFPDKTVLRQKTKSGYNPLIGSSFLFILLSPLALSMFETALLVLLGCTSLAYHIRAKYGVVDVWFLLDQVMVAKNIGFQAVMTTYYEPNVFGLIALACLGLYYMNIVKPAPHNTLERKWKHVGCHFLGAVLYVARFV